MSILKQAEKLSLTPNNLKSLKTIIRHDVIDTFKHLFDSIKGLHDGLKETLVMLNSLDLLADDEESKNKNKIQDLMQQLVEQMKANNNDVDELDKLSKDFNKSSSNDSGLKILSFSDVKTVTILSNKVQDALATSIKDINGELIKAENVKQEDIDLYNVPKNCQRVNIKDLDLQSLNSTLNDTRELYYEYIDENVEVYRAIATKLSNLDSNQIEFHNKLTTDIVKNLVENMSEIIDPINHFKTSYDEIANQVKEGTKLYKKFEFLNDIIS
jgi:hypothetical protein